MSKRIALTLGDPAGIGPEIIVKAVKELSLSQRQRIVVIGSVNVLKKIKGFSSIKKTIEIIDIDNLQMKGFSFGVLSAACGKASLEYLDKAISLVRSGEVRGVVTAPVSKFAIDLVLRGFRGQTEYIGRAVRARSVRMMLLSCKLKFTLVTTHVSLAQACQQLNRADITATISLTAKELRRLFGIKKVKIGVCALNPHLGENGLIGREEQAIIIPAIEEARKDLSDCGLYGPWSLERIVASLMKDELCAGVCLYHDQAILPLKLIYPGKGVNLTLGLGFVRTSPLHGTAFDIAGKNKADPSSLLEAIKLTLELTKK